MSRTVTIVQGQSPIGSKDSSTSASTAVSFPISTPPVLVLHRFRGLLIDAVSRGNFFDRTNPLVRALAPSVDSLGHCVRDETNSYIHHQLYAEAYYRERAAFRAVVKRFGVDENQAAKILLRSRMGNCHILTNLKPGYEDEIEATFKPVSVRVGGDKSTMTP